MILQLSFNSFLKANYEVSPEDLKMISKICKAIRLPQKTLSLSFYLFFAAKMDNNFIEPDDLTLMTSVIDLACKTCETPRSPDKILDLIANSLTIELFPELTKMYKDAINKTELDICKIIDFRFEITEIYQKLQLMCTTYKIDPISSRRCWIVLNDIMKTPMCIYFTIEEILAAATFTIFVAKEYTRQNLIISNEELYYNFCKEYEIKNISLECMKFMYNQIMIMYRLVDKV